jgi:hypothetical protein
MNNEEPYDQVEPVYEKLAPGEVLIISTRGSRFEESVLARR